MVAWRYVTPGYFAALGIPMRRGRAFTETGPRRRSVFGGAQRDPGAPAISPARTRSASTYSAVRRASGSPWWAWPPTRATAGAEKASGPEYYFVRKAVPDVTWANQEPPLGWRGAVAVVRTPVDPKLAAASLRSLFASLDPTLPGGNHPPCGSAWTRATGRPRFQATLLAAFAAIGLLLAAIGLGGVMSFLVAQRRREIGVRMALGATPGSIVRLTLAFAARTTLGGLLAGAGGAFVAARWLRAQLFQVAPGDPRTLAGAVGVLVLVALIAAAGPARRAARVDPMTTLRAE